MSIENQWGKLRAKYSLYLYLGSFQTHLMTEPHPASSSAFKTRGESTEMSPGGSQAALGGQSSSTSLPCKKQINSSRCFRAFVRVFVWAGNAALPVLWFFYLAAAEIFFSIRFLLGAKSKWSGWEGCGVWWLPLDFGNSVSKLQWTFSVLFLSSVGG